MECSAKTKKGVEEAFAELVTRIIHSPRIMGSRSGSPAKTAQTLEPVGSEASSSCGC